MGAIGNATIVGSGIAGPVLGMFLARVGIEARIVESRHESETTGGAFLGVAPNGMRVLDELGVGDAVRAHGFVCCGFAFRNARGERIGTIDRRDDERRLGTSLMMIERAELHRVLLGEARHRGLDLRFEKRLLALEQSDAGVVSRFSTGEEERSDVLFGCDGIRSATRSLVLPDSPAPEFTGLSDVAGIVHFPEAPLEVGWNEMFFGRRAFFGAFKTDSGDVWWFHNAGAETVAAALDPNGLRERVLAAHDDDAPIIREIIERTESFLGPYPLHDILELPRWHSGRVCLVGDAAHATTPSAGQGASLAIEDGLAIARCLRDAGSPEAAFEAFERSRRGRVEEIVRIARRTGGTKAPSGPVAEWFRDRMLPFFLRMGSKAQERAYAHREAWA